MTEKSILRNRVWAALRTAAYPDSRFHWDFSNFIPDFVGSDQCAAEIRASSLYADAECIFITPDNCLSTLRMQGILDRKKMIIPTYGIQRGFWQIESGSVQPEHAAFAASLDGLEHYGKPLDLKDSAALPTPDLLITGASVLNADGVRISDTPSYFDLEWLILDALGLVKENTPILACVHDCQVIEYPSAPQPFGVVVDRIYTPTTCIMTNRTNQQPSLEAWAQLHWQIIQDIPILTELHNQKFGHS